MDDPRGSTWRKWDLYVHTPASLLHQYEGGKIVPDVDYKGDISRYSGQKPAFQALFATKLLPNFQTVSVVGQSGWSWGTSQIYLHHWDCILFAS
jgi:hypothetical protein